MTEAANAAEPTGFWDDRPHVEVAQRNPVVARLTPILACAQVCAILDVPTSLIMRWSPSVDRLTARGYGLAICGVLLLFSAGVAFYAFVSARPALQATRKGIRLFGGPGASEFLGWEVVGTIERTATQYGADVALLGIALVDRDAVLAAYPELAQCVMMPDAVGLDTPTTVYLPQWRLSMPINRLVRQLEKLRTLGASR